MNILNELLTYVPIILILIAIIAGFTGLSGISKAKKILKQRETSYRNMENDFTDLKERVQKELKKN